MYTLYIQFSAIATSSAGLVNALHDLATYPVFQKPIKDEIELTLGNSGGWTKQALLKMGKLDSSVRESLRIHPATTGITPTANTACSIC